jgi:hypothetical protein
LFVALVLGTALPVAAQESNPPPPPELVELVETRFNPPIGTVQRFRIKVTKRGQTHSWIEEMRFERDGDGYLAHWRMDPASFSAEMRHPELAPSFRPFTGVPVTLELDAEGSPVRVRDWEPLKARMLESAKAIGPLMMTATAGRPKPDPAAERKIMEGVNTMFGQLSAETAPDVVIKYLSPALGWGGHARIVGEAVEGVEQADAALFGTSVERKIELTLTEASAETARFVITATIDGAALKDMMTKVAAMFENPDPAIRERARQSLAKLEQLTVVQTTTVLLDRATSLPLRLNQNVASEGKTADTLSIEWLRTERVS